MILTIFFFFFQAEDGIRDYKVTGVQTCALPICFNAFDNQPVSAETFDDNSGGRCLVVGVPFPPGMTARVNPQGGTEEVQFEVCDNDPGKAQSGRIHGFHVDAMRWRTENKEGEGGDTGLTYLTGGNVVDHS